MCKKKYMNKDGVMKIYKKLDEIFDRPYKIQFKGLSFGRDRLTFIAYLYFIYHEEKICIKHTANVVENFEDIEQYKYGTYNCEMYYLPTEKTNINFELADDEIDFKVDDINIFTYYESTFFTSDGIDNRKIRKVTLSEFARGING